jgi:hypothetical protein
MRIIPTVFAIVALLMSTACRTSSTRETYRGEFTREFGTVGLALGTLKALDAGDTNKAYHWNLIFLEESLTRAEELSRSAGPPSDERQMLRSLSKVILSHLEKSKESAARTARTDHLALKITKTLGKTLADKQDKQRVEVLEKFFAAKFIEERKAIEEAEQ